MKTLCTKIKEMNGDMEKKADLISRDLIEPLELYYKHYYSTN